MGNAEHEIATMRRSRGLYVFATLLVIVVGLASRREAGLFPDAWGKYPGDALWTLMIVLLLGAWAPTWSTARIAFLALAISFAVELSQLYQAPWIRALRDTTVGRLTLGSHFNAIDLLAYAIGAALGAWIDSALRRLQIHRRIKRE